MRQSRYPPPTKHRVRTAGPGRLGAFPVRSDHSYVTLPTLQGELDSGAAVVHCADNPADPGLKTPVAIRIASLGDPPAAGFLPILRLPL